MIHSPAILYKIGTFSALFLFVSCNEGESEKVIAEIADLNAELRIVKDARNKLYVKERELKTLIKNFESLQRKERDVRLNLTGIVEYYKDLKAACEYSAALTDKWKAATRISLIGEKLGLVRLSDKTLENAVIVELDKEKVVLKHVGGQDVIELAELPELLRKKLIHESSILLEAELVE